MLIADYASIDGNHTPDFPTFKRWGGAGVIVRGAFTYNGKALVDPMIARDRDAIAAANLVFGGYLIHGWTVELEPQVDALYAALGDHRPGDLPVWLDAESSASLDAYGLTTAQAVARLERTYQLLAERYPCVGVYTSRRWESEILHGIDSAILGAGPLWAKIGYPYKTGLPPHPETRGELGPLPVPWCGSGRGAAILKQFQGDARGVPGIGQCDLSEWLTFDSATAAHDDRTPYFTALLRAHGILATPPNFGIGVETFQRAKGLTPDGIVGPMTFAALCEP